MENQPHVEQEDYIRYYFVLLLDILGQKEQLRKWQQLQPDGTVTPEMIDGIRNSLGNVLKLRKGFFELLESADAGGQQSVVRQWNALSLQPGSERDRYNALSVGRPKLLHFSDMLVAYSPAAAGPADDWNITALYHMLGSVCSLMPTYLGWRIPLRGGICIGTGIEVDGVGFYGPALAEAHHLESKVAGYPRVVVSQQLRDFIRSQPPENNDHADQYIRIGFELCRSMIAEDTDGWTAVDYLGVGSHELLAGDGNLAQARQQAVDRASHFVAEECQRFALAAENAPSESAEKLAAGYQRLKNYFDSRPSVWTDSTAGGTPGGNGAA